MFIALLILVHLYLSQLAVIDTVRSQIGTDEFLNALVYLLRKPNKSCTVNAHRSGPALSIIIKEDNKDIFYADFTFAISCPIFPACAKAFFERRTGNLVHWPDEDVVKKIESLGCHVVPKPSQKHLVFYKAEQSDKSYLDQGAVLEWRYSFSQAEMILSDYIPEEARNAFLAFKATVKTHINNDIDHHSREFHEIPSYVLKTILYYEVEKRPASYWMQPNVKAKFYIILMDALYDCMIDKKCDHYWIPALNLLEDKQDDDFGYFIRRINTFRIDYVKYLASDWLEFQRCIRFHCCTCCTQTYFSEKFLMGFDKIPCIHKKYCCLCFVCRCNYDAHSWEVQTGRNEESIWMIGPNGWCKWTCKCNKKCSYGPITYNPEMFEVY